MRPVEVGSEVSVFSPCMSKPSNEVFFFCDVASSAKVFAECADPDDEVSCVVASSVRVIADCADLNDEVLLRSLLSCESHRRLCRSS